MLLPTTKAASYYSYSVNLLTCLLEVLSALPLGASRGKKEREIRNQIHFISKRLSRLFQEEIHMTTGKRHLPANFEKTCFTHMLSMEHK